MSEVPITIDSFESVVTREKPEKVTAPSLVRGRNIKFVGDSVVPRDGLSIAFEGPSTAASITGLGLMTLADGTRIPLALDSAGNLFKESPAGSGGIETPISTTIGANIYMDVAAAFNRGYIAFSSLQSGSATPRVYHKYTDGTFYLDNIGLAPNATPVTAGGSSIDAGDIQAGTRYCIVIFQTRTGYRGGYTVDAVREIVISESGKKLVVSGIPLGPSNCVGRILAFTQAGASSEGPYYAIIEGASIEGLNADITDTVIEDNQTVTATFNFTDEYLVASTDFTDFDDKIALPNQKSVYYSKTLRRLIWCGEDRDLFRVSEPDDPETYFGTTGFIQPGLGDDGIVQTARDWRGETYLLKDNGAYVVAESTLSPAEWRTPQRWSGSGPMGPWAIDETNDFIFYAHRSGAYIYRGLGPEWIGYPISSYAPSSPIPSWDNINWTYGYLISVCIDVDNKCVRIQVPMGQSTKNNIEFVCDYSRGWRRVRWNYNDIAASRMARIDRVRPADPNTGSEVDNRTSTSQILVASNSPNGRVYFSDPSSHIDDGKPFVQEVQLGYTPSMKTPGVYKLCAVDVAAGGNGQLGVKIFPYQESMIDLDDIDLDGKVSDLQIKCDSDNERWSILLTNKGDANYFELHRVIFWVVRKWATRGS